MGFYHPATLIKDAQRHGVRVLPIAINESDVRCTLCDSPDPRPSSPQQNRRRAAHRLRYVRGLSQAAAEALVAARSEEPFHTIGDVRRRVPLLSPRDLSTLAELGAFARLEGQPSRRSAVASQRDGR